MKIQQRDRIRRVPMTTPAKDNGQRLCFGKRFGCHIDHYGFNPAIERHERCHLYEMCSLPLGVVHGPRRNVKRSSRCSWKNRRRFGSEPWEPAVSVVGMIGLTAGAVDITFPCPESAIHCSASGMPFDLFHPRHDRQRLEYRRRGCIRLRSREPHLEHESDGFRR
jgi:hypothetical protein